MKAEVTFLGHSTVLVEMGGARILTDPVLMDRISILRRATDPPPLDLYADIDLVVISHATGNVLFTNLVGTSGRVHAATAIGSPPV